MEIPWKIIIGAIIIIIIIIIIIVVVVVVIDANASPLRSLWLRVHNASWFPRVVPNAHETLSDARFLLIDIQSATPGQRHSRRTTTMHHSIRCWQIGTCQTQMRCRHINGSDTIVQSAPHGLHAKRSPGFRFSIYIHLYSPKNGSTSTDRNNTQNMKNYD